MFFPFHQRVLSRLLPTLALACLSNFLSAPAALAQTYTITDLGPLPAGDGSNAAGISDTGVTVGQSTFFDGTSEEGYPCLWQSGSVMKIAPLPGGESGISAAFSVNNSGQVVGQSQATPPAGQDYSLQAFTWQNGVTSALPVLAGSTKSYAQKVNDTGQIVGAVYTSDNYRAVLWQNGTVYSLGLPQGSTLHYSFAYAINAQGHIAGTAGGADGHLHPFLWFPTAPNGTSGTMALLGPASVSINSIAYAVNANDDVVGDASQHAFLYHAGVMTDLGTLSGTDTSSADGINDAGQIVGTCFKGIVRHPFLYSNGTMKDLATLVPSDSGWSLQYARAINNRGQIVGSGTNPQGATHAFLLTPASHMWTPVSLSTGPDGFTRLLWDRFDGTASVWKVNASGQIVTQQQYGPYAGWTAKAIATGKDNQTRLLWTKADGTAAYYLLDANNTFVSQQQYGPYTGWAAQGLAVEPDNSLRALWTNTDGTATVWTLDATNHLTTQQQYGPYTGWTARSLAANTDGTERLLWTKSDGTATFWKLSGGSQMIDQRQYGPYSEYSAQAITSAPDGTGRVVWGATDGHISLWTIDASNAYTGQQSQFGPYSGFSFQTIVAGSDGNSRLLWDNVTGQAALWSLTPGGSFATNYQYGPY